MMKVFMMILMLFFLYNLNKFLKFFNILMFISFMLLFDFMSGMYWHMISFNFGFNFFSFMLVILNLWIFNLIFMMKLSSICFNLNLILLVVLHFSFLTMNFLMFYFFFEVSLIIMFLIIVKWGAGSMRLLAGYYLMFYTMFFSFPLLVFLFIVIYMNNLSLMNLMELMVYKLNIFMFVYMLSSFLVKIPMFILHGWLLKAHVEAPVFGSMVLAAILLKLGTYGLLRFMYMFYYNFYFVNLMILVFSLIGGLIISVLCLRQIDMKILVAYSSVVHMSVLLSSMMTEMLLGFIGSYIIMIAHGLCSSGLFYLVNLCYKSSGSRIMFLNKGMMVLMPSTSMFWFMFCSSNMSAPVSLNLVGEVFLLMIIYLWFKYLIYLLIFYCFFSFCYSLYLYIYVQHGKMNFLFKIFNVNLLDYFILLMHWIPLNFMFLNLIIFSC